MRLDHQLDRERTALFEQHLRGSRRRSKHESVAALFIAQSLERAGDHATNLAEEVIHLIERRSVRHDKPELRES